MLDVAILGPLELRHDGDLLRLPGSRQRTLVAILALRAPAVVTTDALIDALWGDDVPADPLARLQWHVASLRRVAGADAVVTRAPGYALAVAAADVDVHRFDRLLDEAHAVLRHDPARAGRMLGEALRLWRGPPLADLRDDAWVVAERRRLEDRRLGAMEDLLGVVLADGDAAAAVAEAERLLGEHPYRERLHALRMRGLYALGRQAHALEAFHEARQALGDEYGVEPTPELRALHRAILDQVGDASLVDPPWTRPAAPAGVEARTRGTIAVVSAGPLDALVDDAAVLALAPPGHDLLLVRLLDPSAGGGLDAEVARLDARRLELADHAVAARVAVFTTHDHAADVLRLLDDPGVDLALLEAPPSVRAGMAPAEPLERILHDAACDVALATGPVQPHALPDAPVVILFGGGEHDWAALEIAAWRAAAEGRALLLAGTAADEASGRRDASRLLAVASLAVQQLIGLVARPLLVPRSVDAVVSAAQGASVLVLPFRDRWWQEGIGEFRAAVAARADARVLLVRAGKRAGGLSPPEGVTRYTWTDAAP